MAVAFPVRALILASVLALATACEVRETEARDTTVAAPATPASTGEPAAAMAQPVMTLPVDAVDPVDCKVPQAAIFAGRRANATVRAELVAAVAPVTAIRWIAPGEPTTDDLQPRRLNVLLDPEGTIVSAHCG